MPEKKSIKIKKSDLWKYSTFVLLAVAIIFAFMIFSGSCITGKAISKEEAGENLMNFAKEEGIDLEIIKLEDIGNFYEVSAIINSYSTSLLITKDGKYIINGLIPIIEETTQPQQTILQCATDYGLEEDTIIFYYSDSCGYCSMMKPGVDSLEEQGYKIYRAEASKSDSLITNCVLDHMTSGAVPQFICVKTGEIKVGAFVDYDTEGNPYLDQEAMDAWAESCLAG